MAKPTVNNKKSLGAVASVSAVGTAFIRIFTPEAGDVFQNPPDNTIPFIIKRLSTMVFYVGVQVFQYAPDADPPWSPISDETQCEFIAPSDSALWQNYLFASAYLGANVPDSDPGIYNFKFCARPLDAGREELEPATEILFKAWNTSTYRNPTIVSSILGPIQHVS